MRGEGAALMAPPVGAGDPQRPDHRSGAVQAARLGSFLGLELGREGSCSILPQDYDLVTQVPSPVGHCPRHPRPRIKAG